MIFRQITHDDLGCASYSIGDDDAGIAAVVDPRFEIDEYLRLARYLGVHIDHVFETHTHADHVSGHGRLAAATGATVHIHADAGADYDHEPFSDGDEIALGALVVRVLHTPGHRPEHSSFALIDTRRGEEPWAVLSGDSLFVNDIARPDLAVEKSDGARAIFASLHEQLLGLADDVEVWPAHLGGSMCGGPAMDHKTSSTIGYERRHNALLGIDDQGAFVDEVLAGLGPQPPNFKAIVEINRGPLVTDGVELLSLTPRQVAVKRNAGALVMDVRTDQQFDDAHIPGAICNPMTRSGFGTRLAWLADPEREIVLIGRDDDDGRAAGRLAVAVGVRRLAGFLGGGMTSWRQEGRDAASIERLPVGELPDRDDLQVLDVRERSEWDAGHLEGSAFAPWHDIDGIPDGLDGARPIAVICASGQRAATAASLLARAGAEHVVHVVDGGVGALPSSRRWRIAARGSNLAARRLGPAMRLAGRMQAGVFEASGGRLWKKFLGTPVIVLEVVGRKSGELRKTPLLYAMDGERWILLAANGGSPRTPAWWLNLRAAGGGVVVARGKRIDVTAREATAEEYDPLFAKLVANYPPVADYRTFTDRRIPVVVLEAR